MDFTNWSDRVYNIVPDFEDFENTFKYVENRVTSVGGSLKKLYSAVALDFSPLSADPTTEADTESTEPDQNSASSADPANPTEAEEEDSALKLEQTEEEESSISEDNDTTSEEEKVNNESGFYSFMINISELSSTDGELTDASEDDSSVTSIPDVSFRLPAFLTDLDLGISTEFDSASPRSISESLSDDSSLCEEEEEEVNNKSGFHSFMINISELSSTDGELTDASEDDSSVISIPIGFRLPAFLTDLGLEISSKSDSDSPRSISESLSDGSSLCPSPFELSWLEEEEEESSISEDNNTTTSQREEDEEEEINDKSGFHSFMINISELSSTDGELTDEKSNVSEDDSSVISIPIGFRLPAFSTDLGLEISSKFDSDSPRSISESLSDVSSLCLSPFELSRLASECTKETNTGEAIETRDLSLESNDDSCVIVDDVVHYAVSRRAQRLRSYKDKIREIFTSKKRLVKEYEKLAIWCRDVNLEHTPSSRDSEGRHSCDLDWEIL